MALNESIMYVLQNEGGYTHCKEDPGGVTNFGITQRAYEEYMGQPVSDYDMQTMTKPAAVNFYYHRYWMHYSLYLIKIQASATACLDTLVNLGPSAGARLIQLACQSPVVDSQMGPDTVAIINGDDAGQFIRGLRLELENHYQRLVVENPGLSIFLKGWLNRSKRLGTLV